MNCRTVHHDAGQVPQKSRTLCSGTPFLRVQCAHGIFPPRLDHAFFAYGDLRSEITSTKPKANCICEHVIDILRRECPDYYIPITEFHLQHITKRWESHFDKARPHPSIGPDTPYPSFGLPVTLQTHRHLIQTK